MTEPLTDRQLAAMQARESAATPPPWNAVDATDGFVALVRTDGADARTLARVAVAADGEFMARARADMPALLAEVTRLRTELEQARETGEPLRAAHFHEAARLLEDTGRDDDAVNLLDNVAAGIAHLAAPACSCGARPVHQDGSAGE